MNERILCWGQLNQHINTFQPNELKIIDRYTGLSLTRNENFVWKDNEVYSWGGSFEKMPEILEVMSSKVIKVVSGVNSPMIITAEGGNNHNRIDKEITKIVSTSSGYIYLNKLHQVFTLSTHSLMLSSIIDIASDCSEFFALSVTGQVYKWAHIHVPKPLGIDEKIEKLSCGAQHSFFVSSFGNTFVLGSNAYGQISLGSVKNTTQPILLQGITCKKVVCGGFHTLLLSNNDEIYSCGLGNMGQLINNSYSNKDFLSVCEIPEEFGEILDVFCTEMTSFVVFATKEESQKTFRPSNLQPKSSITAFITRLLVAEAERNYLDKVSNREKSKLEHEKKQLKREKKIQNDLVVFESKIIPNWESLKNTKEVMQLIRGGIPSKVRGQIWKLLVGNPLKVTQEVFQRNLEKAKSLQFSITCGEELTIRENSLRLISLDISRTFNNLGYFSAESPLNKDLRELLEAASVYRSDVGYIQGMSYVAGMLLLNLDLLQSFQIFVKIISSPLLLSFYQIDQEGIQCRERIFCAILKENLPALALHFENEGVQLAIFLMEWFVTLYSKTFNQEVAVRVWDLYFYCGDFILFKIGIAIMKVLAERLMNCDLTGIMECVSKISDHLHDPEYLIELSEQVKISEALINQIKSLP